MKKAYLKLRMKYMILFTIYDLFTMNVYDGNGRKPPKNIQKYESENKGKDFPFGCPPIPRMFSGVRKLRKKARPTISWTYSMGLSLYVYSVYKYCNDLQVLGMLTKYTGYSGGHILNAKHLASSPVRVYDLPKIFYTWHKKFTLGITHFESKLFNLFENPFYTLYMFFSIY